MSEREERKKKKPSRSQKHTLRLRYDSLRLSRDVLEIFYSVLIRRSYTPECPSTILTPISSLKISCVADQKALILISCEMQ